MAITRGGMISHFLILKDQLRELDDSHFKRIMKEREQNFNKKLFLLF